MIAVAAVIATGGGPSSYRRCVDVAFTGRGDARRDRGRARRGRADVGLARVGEATVELGTALGYDIDGALEGLDPPGGEILPSE